MATAGLYQRSPNLTTDNSLNKTQLTDIQVTAREIRAGPTEDEITLIKGLMLKQKSTDTPEMAATSDHGQTKTAETFELNKEQEDIRQQYLVYLKTGDKSRVPPVTLLHGRAGTGKTAVIKRIIADAEKLGRKTIRTAFNAINSIAMRGPTTCHLCSVSPKVHFNAASPLTTSAFKRIAAEAEGAFLLLVDEISNYPPHILARLSNCLCQYFKTDKPFGNIPVILIGDQRQMGPVKAVTLTYSLIDVLSVKTGKKRNARSGAVKKFMEKLSLDGLLRNVPVPEEQGVGYAVNKYNASHPYKIGGELLSKARWF